MKNNAQMLLAIELLMAAAERLAQASSIFNEVIEADIAETNSATVFGLGPEKTPPQSVDLSTMVAAPPAVLELPPTATNTPPEAVSQAAPEEMPPVAALETLNPPVDGAATGEGSDQPAVTEIEAAPAPLDAGASADAPPAPVDEAAPAPLA